MRFLSGIAAQAALTMLVATAAAAQTPLPAAKPGAPNPGQLNPGQLNPGKSAGVHAAQQARTGLALVGAGAIVAVVIVAAGTGGGNAGGQANSQSTPVTTATP